MALKLREYGIREVGQEQISERLSLMYVLSAQEGILCLSVLGLMKKGAEEPGAILVKALDVDEECSSS